MTRFNFGKNWQKYSKNITPERIETAKKQILDFTGLPEGWFEGKNILDVGCGSGLQSLIFNSMGSDVLSIDCDVDAIECAERLRVKRQYPYPPWAVEHMNILNLPPFYRTFSFDLVYAWGSLHHTGDMWKAMDIVSKKVLPNGYLYISIYNDQAYKSQQWLKIKKRFNRLPKFLQTPYAYFVMERHNLRFAINPTYLIHPRTYIINWINTIKRWLNLVNFDVRGMDYRTNVIDWIGGYPYEYAKPDEVIKFYLERGYVLKNFKYVGEGHGCNEFFFQKV